MGLINCPECQKKVSSKAKTCPNCGFSIASYKKKQEQGYGCLVLIAILIVAPCFTKNSTNDKTNQTANNSNQTIHSKQIEKIKWHRYTTVALNVRKEPTKNSKKIYVLPKGSNVGVIKNYKDWSKIRYSNNNTIIIGWVNSKYLQTIYTECVPIPRLMPKLFPFPCVKRCFKTLSSLSEHEFEIYTEKICKNFEGEFYTSCILAAGIIGAAQYSEKKIPLDFCEKATDLSFKFCETFYCNVKN